MTDNVNKEYIDNFEANHMDDIDAIVQLLPKINKVEILMKVKHKIFILIQYLIKLKVLLLILIH